MSEIDVYIKVGVIIENNKNEILLIKEKVDQDSPLAWNIVKGSYETRDGKLEECAKRECLEEAGLDVEILGFNSIMFFPKEDKLKIQYNFIARPKSNDATLPSDRNISIDGENIQLLKWMSPAEITKLNPNDFVADYTLSVIKRWQSDKKIYSLNILQYL